MSARLAHEFADIGFCRGILWEEKEEEIRKVTTYVIFRYGKLFVKKYICCILSSPINKLKLDTSKQVEFCLSV